MMTRKLLIGVLGVLLVLVTSDLAWSLVEGDWDVAGKVSVTVSIKGYRTQKETTLFTDEFSFESGKAFEGVFWMIDCTGTWEQTGKRYTVSLDPDEISSFFNTNLSALAGLDAEVEITKLTFTGTENPKANTIKGKVTLNMDLVLLYGELELKGKAKANASFTGIRAIEGEVASRSERESADRLKTLGEIIAEKMVDAVRASGASF